LASVDALNSIVVSSFPSYGISEAADVLTASSDSCGKGEP
jgi:hypothetical protein